VRASTIDGGANPYERGVLIRGATLFVIGSPLLVATYLGGGVCTALFALIVNAIVGTSVANSEALRREWEQAHDTRNASGVRNESAQLRAEKGQPRI